MKVMVGKEESVHEFEMTGEEKVKYLKEMIFKKTGLAVEEQKLEFGEVTLDDDSLLSSYSTEDEIFVLLKRDTLYPEPSTEAKIDVDPFGGNKKNIETADEDTSAANE